MRIGVPKEVKIHEYRVGLVPCSVRELIQAGHEVVMETGAGEGCGFPDEAYTDLGAKVLPTAAAVFETAEMIVKVKEPQPQECAMLREGQLLFTYLHLAPDPIQAEGLIKSKATAIAYETVTGPGNSLPLLAPMSEVAGRMSVQVGSRCLEKESGGRGVLLGGIPGVAPGKVVVIGGGVVGTNAARIAMGMGAEVTILDRSVNRLRVLDELYDGRLRTMYSTQSNVEELLKSADLVVGAVLIPGAAAPKVVTKEMLGLMPKGSVLVDVSIDQGGCFETSRPTTHDKPTYVVDDILHYCVTNMPGAVARTSAMGLNNVTLPFVKELANHGWREALLKDPHLQEGLNVHDGQITYKKVAQALDLPYTPTGEVL